MRAHAAGTQSKVAREATRPPADTQGGWGCAGVYDVPGIADDREFEDVQVPFRPPLPPPDRRSHPLAPHDLLSPSLRLRLKRQSKRKVAAVDSHQPSPATTPQGAWEFLGIPKSESGESWLTAAIPTENPYCSCKLTRVRSSADSVYQIVAGILWLG